MSAVKQISATARDRVGKGAARAVRREGKIPAVIYGAGKAPTPISLDANETNLLVVLDLPVEIPKDDVGTKNESCV